MYVSVLEGGLGGALGVDGGLMPLPTRPQRYCDPASLVIRINNMLSKIESNQPAKFFMQNRAKNFKFFTFFKKILAREH